MASKRAKVRAGKFSKTEEHATVNAAVFTDTGGPPMPFGWQGPRPIHPGPLPLPTAPSATLGNVDPGRIQDFVQGARESYDHRARPALEMVGVYLGVRAWSAWRHQN